MELVSPHTFREDPGDLSIYSVSWKREYYITAEEFNDPEHYKLFNVRMKNWEKMVEGLKENELKYHPSSALQWDN